MELVFGGREIKDETTKGLMERAAACVLQREDITNDDIEISITFVSDDEIRQLNKDHRGIDSVTDVLSFPQYESPEDIRPDGFVPLGDVVIDLEQAKRQAAEYGHSEEREIIYLFVHSILHLLGYDHMEDGKKTKMRAAEEDVMEKLDLSR